MAVIYRRLVSNSTVSRHRGVAYIIKVARLIVDDEHVEGAKCPLQLPFGCAPRVKWIKGCSKIAPFFDGQALVHAVRDCGHPVSGNVSSATTSDVEVGLPSSDNILGVVGDVVPLVKQEILGVVLQLTDLLYMPQTPDSGTNDLIKQMRYV